MRLDPVGVVHPERAAVPPAAELAHDPEDRGLTAAADPERRHHPRELERLARVVERRGRGERHDPVGEDAQGVRVAPRRPGRHAARRDAVAPSLEREQRPQRLRHAVGAPAEAAEDDSPRVVDRALGGPARPPQPRGLVLGEVGAIGSDGAADDPGGPANQVARRARAGAGVPADAVAQAAVLVEVAPEALDQPVVAGMERRRARVVDLVPAGGEQVGSHGLVLRVRQVETHLPGRSRDAGVAVRQVRRVAAAMHHWFPARARNRRRSRGAGAP